LKTRDSRGVVTGGIYIKSPIIASQVKKVYDETIEKALRITSENCEKVVKTLKASLMDIHSRK
ncbi:MAG: hypothetical protein V1703_04440, partial [Candidatus Altiarchaeota archaeon]